LFFEFGRIFHPLLPISTTATFDYQCFPRKHRRSAASARKSSQLQRAGIGTASVEALLQRMLDKIDGLCGGRNKLERELPAPMKADWEGGSGEILQRRPEPAAIHQCSCGSPAIGATGRVVRPARPAITVAIDQYAEKALGNREYFLNKPYSIGGGRQDHVP